ncbi:hypothetical protein UFOVP181_429 [uncultured Caudovirales phage]|uniref:Uncharacterized protein n=1 Tax=uncultured Caudovirales phage TaxID=2100421 RepID=A0A6J5KWZ8_9CAUD|nr:hypothetical protein UFOVP57_210 [uncultured Caudovirales phage]CAB5209332.1 hypothetical protein UFOVP181_429 [uncultured Caudovirales phage]
MFTVTIREHLLYDATQYLEHNQQYLNKEYYRSRATNGDLTYTFTSKERYQAFSAFIERRARFT